MSQCEWMEGANFDIETITRPRGINQKDKKTFVRSEAVF